MDGRPILCKLARLMHEHRLDAVLVGMTAVDLDFLYRKTPANLKKLRAVAKSLKATIWRPIYPASDLRRLWRDADLLQVDFAEISGRQSFASVRRRAKRIDMEGYPLFVSDRVNLRARHRRELPHRETPERPDSPARSRRLAALRVANERARLEQIRTWLRTPPNRRTHFLRKRIGIQASCL